MRSDGPLYWKSTTAECGETRQSPINLLAKKATMMDFGDFVFNGYDSEKPNAGTLVSIRNLGHTARITVDGNFTISGGGLPTEYKVGQAHFHWGTIDQQGSEHAVNGRLFPLEMHIVHYASQEYNDDILQAATSGEKDGLAVLGVLFEIGESDNQNFDEVINGVSNIRYEGEEHFFENVVSLYKLLPDDKSRFYRYDGSLTTPPCYEVVQWTVFEDTVKISERQLDHFRKLEEGLRNESHVIGNCYRPLQPIHDRVVYRSKQGGQITTPDPIIPTCSAATVTKPFSFFAAIVLMLLFFSKRL